MFPNLGGYPSSDAASDAARLERWSASAGYIGAADVTATVGTCKEPQARLPMASNATFKTHKLRLRS